MVTDKSDNTEKTTPTSSGSPGDLILVIIGGLGDWCIRRVLADAIKLEEEWNAQAEFDAETPIDPKKMPDKRPSYLRIFVVDLQERSSIESWIVRRLIEQSAEELDQPSSSQQDSLATGKGLDPSLVINPQLPDPTDSTSPTFGKPELAVVELGERLTRFYKTVWDDLSVDSTGREGRKKLKAALRTKFPDGTRDQIDNTVEQVAGCIEKVWQRLSVQRNTLRDWLCKDVDLADDVKCPRYWQSVESGETLLMDLGPDMECPLDVLMHTFGASRIITYAAVPPDAYDNILRHWSPHVERIAVEKPVAGLLECGPKGHQLTRQSTHTTVQTTDRIRAAVTRGCEKRSREQPPLRVLTVDHYNAKWAVHAIEWLRRRKIADHILRCPSRIYAEVLESGIVPYGRFGFYNGVGGALGDMLAHLIQPIRALTGYATVAELLDVLRILRIGCARYRLNEKFQRDPLGYRTVSRAELEHQLFTDTETFGVAELEFTRQPWAGTRLYLRTGKGFVPPSKQIVVEAFDDDGPVQLVCDIENRRIDLRVPAEGTQDAARGPVALQTTNIPIPGLVKGRPLRRSANEYVEVLWALCEEEPPDPRYFPPFEEAVAVFDFFYQALLVNRARLAADPSRMATYAADYAGQPVKHWLADRAGWQRT